MLLEESQPKTNFLMQTLKSILILKFNDTDIVASPLDLQDTIKWYEKEIGEKIENFNYVDIRKEGMWSPIEENDSEYEDLDLLNYINGVVELVRYSASDLFGNVRYVDGELCKYISIEEYCNKYLKSGRQMKEPEVIASTEV